MLNNSHPVNPTNPLRLIPPCPLWIHYIAPKYMGISKALSKDLVGSNHVLEEAFMRYTTLSLSRAIYLFTICFFILELAHYIYPLSSVKFSIYKSCLTSGIASIEVVKLLYIS